MASVFKKIKKFFGGILRFLGKFSERFPPAIHFGRISRNYHARLIFKAVLFPVSVWHYFWIKINSALISEEKLPCEFAVAAIVKNEAPYIAEWIRYYKLLGADKIILYDNNSTDNLLSVLDEFIRSGFVDYRAMGGGCRQLDAYNDALNKYYKKVRYIAFFDADEFLYDNGGNPKKTIAEIFAQHPEAGGIGVNWQLFGSSGHVKKPQGGVLENYLHRAETQWKINLHIKSIVNPRKTFVFVRNPHAADYFKNFCAVTCSGIPVEDAITKTVDVTKMHLNHYFSKSKEEFEKKRLRGKADNPSIRSENEFFVHDRNEIYDDSMLKYAELLKNCR